MDLRNDTELANTRRKLALLEAMYKREAESEDDPLVREMTLDSIVRDIKQFKEEIIRYEARQKVEA